MPGNAYVLPTYADVKKMPFFTNLRLFFRILTPKKPLIWCTIWCTFTPLYTLHFLVFICHGVAVEMLLPMLLQLLRNLHGHLQSPYGYTYPWSLRFLSVP